MTATRRAVTKKMFFAINRSIKDDIRDKTYRAEDIAGEYGVGAATVRVIRRTGTWQKFEDLKAARRTPKEAETTANDGVKPLQAMGSLDERVKDLEEELSLMKLSLSRAHERIGNHYEAIKKLQGPRRWWRR